MRSPFIDVICDATAILGGGNLHQVVVTMRRHLEKTDLGIA
jgi:hypothetical protein